MEGTDIEKMKFVFDVNVFGLMRMTSKFAYLLRENHARVVNIGSLAGIFSRPLNGVYSASKFAVEALSDATRLEMKHLGVSVSLVQPGAVVSFILFLKKNQ